MNMEGNYKRKKERYSVTRKTSDVKNENTRKGKTCEHFTNSTIVAIFRTQMEIVFLADNPIFAICLQVMALFEE